VAGRKIVRDRHHQRTETSTNVASQPAKLAEADSGLPALAARLDSLLAELAAVRGLSDELNIDLLRRGPRPEKSDAEKDCDTGTSQIEVSWLGSIQSNSRFWRHPRAR
jgi:hypothetical protein